MRNHPWAVAWAILWVAGAASAQTKISVAEQCGRPTSEYTIPVGDHPGHVFRIEQTSCTEEPALEIGGVAVKEHHATGFSEMDGGKGKDHWFHVFVMANGDSVFARSEGTAEFDGLRFRSSSAEWTFLPGTGKFQGLKGSGTLKCHPGTGGFACQAEGEYSLPAS
jgi:hypothetical protein